MARRATGSGAGESGASAGTRAHGRDVVHRFKGRPRATVVVTDGSGSQATARTPR